MPGEGEAVSLFDNAISFKVLSRDTDGWYGLIETVRAPASALVFVPKGMHGAHVLANWDGYKPNAHHLLPRWVRGVSRRVRCDDANC